MLKNILKLKGVQELNQSEQKNIVAGYTPAERACYNICVRYGGGTRSCLRKCFPSIYP